MDGFVQLTVNVAVPCVKPIVPGHFEIFFRDVLYQQFNEINGREGLPYKGIIFMPVVVECHIVTIIGIDPGKGNDRASKITADIFNNGFGVAEVRFGIDIKTVFVFAVYFRFGLLEGRADPVFQFIQKDGLEGFTEVSVIEIFDSAPEAVIRKPAFCKEAVDVRVPFKGASKGMEDADKARDKVFRLIEGEKKFFYDISHGFKEAV